MELEEFSELVDNIEAALVRFESTSNHAVLRLYRRSDFQDAQPHLGQSSHNVGAESNNESVFVVYL
jgi:hypothetical protein